ncbi:phenylacetate--CoA ligase family protein [Rhodococcus sp. 077-4]|uniref:phenylacetate--CoA ligase family protein n=1 Tax=Rhodococcus sp. 077-4 TaxID=2789271 RepID=UPI0039F4E954
MKPADLHDPSHTALRLVQSIALSVPAYRRLLDQHGIDASAIETMTDLEQLPTTSKDTYRRANALSDLQAGRPEDVETIASSAGSSGTPTFWSRGQRSTDHGAAMFGHVLRECADTEHRATLALVTFPLGPYIGGAFMYAMLLELRKRGHRLSIATPGMDPDVVADVVSEAADGYQQIVIFAYPPIARDLLDTHGDLFRRHNVVIIVGGEPVSEAWRSLVHTMLGDNQGDRVRVVYGATDVGFVGYETAATITVRSAAARDSGLNLAMFGTEYADEDIVQQPAFVQYRPEFTYIEVDSDGYLLFTVGGVLPLVRYRVNDRGDTLVGSAVRARLVDAGYPALAEDIDPNAHYLLVFGRTDVAAIYSAVNIYPDYFRPAVEHISLATRLTGRFIARCETDNEQRQTLTLDVELRPQQQPDPETAEQVRQLSIASLRQLSAEYRVVHDQKGQEAEPVVRLRPFRSDGFVTGGKQKSVE